MQRNWNSKIAKNYRDTMLGLRRAGKKLNWMGASVWDAWVAWWNNDEFKVINLSYISHYFVLQLLNILFNYLNL